MSDTSLVAAVMRSRLSLKCFSCLGAITVFLREDLCLKLVTHLPTAAALKRIS
ncbi:MAG: hypothetical protein ABL985_19215 [Casimicrobium sp.]